MQVWDAECAARVAKHRAMRAEKQFATVECPKTCILSACRSRAPPCWKIWATWPPMSCTAPTAAACRPSRRRKKCWRGFEAIAAQCNHLIIVSNEVFSGGADYAGETDLYLQALAMVNNAVAAKADAVCRVVCGLPVYYKGGERP